MKSSILVARIMRVIETDGLLGDGAGLACAFNEAVKAVNTRLESVQAAEASGQTSDAVRLMEDSPRLIDEINALDFNSLPEWEALCDRNGWQKPVAFDRTLIEKTLMFSESKAVAEPFLRMYRKAVRTNNNLLAVKALRRLVDVDQTQNWEANLVQAESVLQRELAEAFAAARSANDAEEQDRLAREILETAWQNKPTGRAFSDIQNYWKDKEARRREAEGLENLTLLRRCRDENWNRTLAFSMIQALDTLAESGWTLPLEERGMVDECRRRVADEMEAAEKEQRWKSCCETLHGAIQREDPVAIREAFAAPEFLDHEPPEDLLRDAQRVIEHDEAARRRKVRQIAVCSLLALVAVLGVSGWWLKQKLFSMRCEGEVAKMRALAEGAHPIDRLDEALRKLQEEDPDVYADPRVNVFQGKLKSMISANLARTNELVEILASLAHSRDAQWADDNGTVTGKLARVESLLTRDDADYRARWLKLKSAYAEHVAEKDEATRKKATKRHETLTARMHDLSVQLTGTIGGEDQDRALAVCKADAAEWRESYGALLPVLDGKLTEAEKELADAEQKQKNVREALGKLRAAQTAPEMLEARKALIDFYGSYSDIKRLTAHPIEVATAHEVLTGTTSAQKAFAAVGNSGIASDKFKTFLEEGVCSLKGAPSFYSLYGLMVAGDNSGSFFAVSKGRPDFKKPSYANAWQISGELLDFASKKMSDKIEKKIRMGFDSTGIKVYEIPSVDEVRTWVDLAAQANLTAGQFENEVLKKIEEHLRVINKVEHGKKAYLESERNSDVLNILTRGRYTALRRVIMLNIYFRWLKEDLGVMPPDGGLTRWTEKIAALAQPINVDGVPEDLSWVCLWERRVRQRNRECVDLLEKIPADWTARYRKWRAARSMIRDIARWKVETAGQLLFNPLNPWQKKDPTAVIPIVAQAVKTDHPLYVLRTGADSKLQMVKALIPSGDKWAMVAGAGHMPGEPLYQICRDGKPIDAEKEIKECLKTLPEQMAKSFVAKIPFFDMEEKK